MLFNLLKLLMAGFTMGWGSCLVYTAPLLLPYIGGTKTNWRDGFKAGLMFSIGRILALAVLGGLVTVAFSFISRFFSPRQSGWLYLVLALFMITAGILIILGKTFKPRIRTPILDRSTGSIFLLGFLMGIAPCVPHIVILTYIAGIAENNVLAGIMYAVMFATGTAIAPVVLGALAGVLPEKLYRRGKLLRIFQVICGIILAFFGLSFIYYVITLSV
ncbi:MAG: sulfite exporter TauE/SafE family protein [Candidatus Omnitrophota bacterium]|nr:sulfite exporter TauE/SafE family protein [Candidatus Omnitrophota bacterium]